MLIPISEWELLTRKHEDLKNLEAAAQKTNVQLSDLAGKLSYETAEEMLHHLAG